MALIGYMRVSKSDGSQTTDLQRDALIAAGVDPDNLYEDKASGKKEDRPELASCLKALRPGDTLLVWKLDRLGRDLRHLINIVHDLTEREVGLKVLTGQGAAVDTTSAQGKLVFGILATLAEFERELISERTKAGLESARARGRKGGRPFKMTPAKVRLAEGIALAKRAGKYKGRKKALSPHTDHTSPSTGESRRIQGRYRSRPWNWTCHSLPCVESTSIMLEVRALHHQQWHYSSSPCGGRTAAAIFSAITSTESRCVSKPAISGRKLLYSATSLKVT